jgi:glycosyltransferase involved in cell wall biosynthesis
MKVISLLVTNFKNDNRVYRMAKSLSQSGFPTTVVAWKKGDVLEKENFNGVDVERITIGSGRWKRSNIFIGAIQYFEFAFRALKKYRSADVWHCNDYEAFLIGVLAKIARPKLKLVYDCHELESHRNGKGAFMRFAIRILEKLFIPWTELVITVSPSIQEFYMKSYNLKDVALVRNLPNEMNVTHSNTLREKLGISDDRMVFLYQGMLGKGRGIEVLIEAFKVRKTQDAALVFMGFGELKASIEACASTNENIFFVPAVSYAEIPLYTGSADVGVNSVEPTCLSYEYSLPNKLFEYIQSEIPVLTNSLRDCAALVNEFQVGRVISSWNSETINVVVDEMLKEDLSVYQSNLKSAKKILNWEVEEQVLISAYKTIPHADKH